MPQEEEEVLDDPVQREQDFVEIDCLDEEENIDEQQQQKKSFFSGFRQKKPKKEESDQAISPLPVEII